MISGFFQLLGLTLLYIKAKCAHNNDVVLHSAVKYYILNVKCVALLFLDEVTFKGNIVNSINLLLHALHTNTHTHLQTSLFLCFVFMPKVCMEWPGDSQNDHGVVSSCMRVYIWVRSLVGLSVSTHVNMCSCVHITRRSLKYSAWYLTCACVCTHTCMCDSDNRPFVARGAAVTLFSEESNCQSVNPFEVVKLLQTTSASGFAETQTETMDGRGTALSWNEKCLKLNL